MNQKTLGFIGGGRVVRILLEGWRRAGRLPDKVRVYDCNEEVLAKLSSRFPTVEVVSEKAAAAEQEVVFLAVHPPVMGEAVSGLAGM